MFGEDTAQISVLPAKIPLETRQQFFHFLVGKCVDPGENVAGSLDIARTEQSGDHSLRIGIQLQGQACNGHRHD